MVRRRFEALRGQGIEGEVGRSRRRLIGAAAATAAAATLPTARGRPARPTRKANGYMDGAVRSGERAAKEVLAAL